MCFQIKQRKQKCFFLNAMSNSCTQWPYCHSINTINLSTALLYEELITAVSSALFLVSFDGRWENLQNSCTLNTGDKCSMHAVIMKVDHTLLLTWLFWGSASGLWLVFNFFLDWMSAKVCSIDLRSFLFSLGTEIKKRERKMIILYIVKRTSSSLMQYHLHW